MKSWDYIDPKIALKYAHLNQQINQLKQKRKQIITNTKLTKSGKQKLLKFNDDCLRDLVNILNGHKDQMVDYFDQQVCVLTQKQVKMRNQQTATVRNFLNIQHEKEKSLEMTRLDFNGENGVNISQYLNKTRTLHQSTDQSGSYRGLDATKTTQRRKRVKSFNLHPTNKTINLQQDYTIKKNKKKAYASRALVKRLKRKINTKDRILRESNVRCQTLECQLNRMYQENQENNQLIALLYHKISILEKNAKKEQQQFKATITKQFEQKLRDLHLKYGQLENVQRQNQQLIFKRKQVLKSVQKIKENQKRKK